MEKALIRMNEISEQIKEKMNAHFRRLLWLIWIGFAFIATLITIFHFI